MDCPLTRLPPKFLKALKMNQLRLKREDFSPILRFLNVKPATTDNEMKNESKKTKKQFSLF